MSSLTLQVIQSKDTIAVVQKSEAVLQKYFLVASLADISTSKTMTSPRWVPTTRMLPFLGWERSLETQPF